MIIMNILCTRIHALLKNPFLLMSVNIFIVPLVISVAVRLCWSLFGIPKGIVYSLVSYGILSLILLGLKLHIGWDTRSIGLSLKNAPKSFAWGICVAGLYSLLIKLVFPSNYSVPSIDFLILSFYFLNYGILIPFAEELWFRGVLMTSFLKTWKPSFCIILSASLFALIHLVNDTFTFFVVFVFGTLLATIRVKTNNIIGCIVAHGAVNCINLMLGNIP